MGFLKNDCVPSFSTYKGHSYIYKMSNFDTARGHQMECMRTAQNFLKQSGITRKVEFRYPTAVRRVFGNTNPGEKERRARKTGERKQTRGEVELLCKYMLFKKRKFTPGKMI